MSNLEIDQDSNCNVKELFSNMKIDSELDEVSSISSKKYCSCCLKEIDGSLRCGKCRSAIYCNRSCQLKHWESHKHICKDSNCDDSSEKLRLKANNHLKQGMYIVCQK